jgi:hypothetical protein
MPLVTDIPYCVCLLICEYLTSLSIFQTDIDKTGNLNSWRNFCNSSHLFKELKKNSCIYNLNIAHSFLYLCVGSFNKEVFKKELKTSDDKTFDWKEASSSVRQLPKLIQDPSTQVHLHISTGFTGNQSVFKSSAQELKFLNSFFPRIKEYKQIQWSQKYFYFDRLRKHASIIMSLSNVIIKHQTANMFGFKHSSVHVDAKKMFDFGNLTTFGNCHE